MGNAMLLKQKSQQVSRFAAFRFHDLLFKTKLQNFSVYRNIKFVRIGLVVALKIHFAGNYGGFPPIG